MQSSFDLIRFRRQLVETIAWCSAHGSTADVEFSLRSSVPVMPDVFHNWRDKEDKATQFQRRQRSFDTFFAARNKRVEAENIDIDANSNDLAGGQLLIFDFDWESNEGAMYLDSDGFFDGDKDSPPWDTWVYFEPLENLFIWWSPPAFMPYINAGMRVMTLDWIRWLNGNEDYEFVQILKREGFFDDSSNLTPPQ